MGEEKNINLNLGSQITYVDNKNKPADDILTPDVSSENIAAYAILDYEKDNFEKSIQAVRDLFKDAQKIDPLLK